MSNPTLIKDPLDKRKITIDFSTWLGSSTIASAAWITAGLTADNDSETTTSAINYLSGGSDGDEVEIACTITTADGVPRLKTQRFLMRVETGF